MLSLLVAAVLSLARPTRASSAAPPLQATLQGLQALQGLQRASWPTHFDAQWDPGPADQDVADRRLGLLSSVGPSAAGEPAGQTPRHGVGDSADDEDDEQVEQVQAEESTDQVGLPDRAEQRELDVPLVPEDADDSEAQASEVLPMPAPLSMAGHGPPMTLSLEDMDYLTILRPPQRQQPQQQPASKGSTQRGPNKNKRKSNNNNNKNNKGVKVVKQQSSRPQAAKPQATKATKTKGTRGKPAPQSTASSGPPQRPPPGPPSGGPMMVDSYAGAHMAYEPSHPYGYGYGYAGLDYPRYPDPIMSHEYQQATSYPEEERFRPVRPPMGSPMGSPMGMGPHMGPHMPPLSPMASNTYGVTHPLASPLAPSGAPLGGFDPYLAYHNRDYHAGSPQHHGDQRPSGAVQVSQSVSAGEHHSSHDASWLHGLGSTSTTTSSDMVSPSPSALPASSTASTDPTATRKATLRDILAQDCPGAEDLGYCDSPPRYPMQQVAEAIERCTEVLDHMYAPPPEERDPESEGEGACHSVRRTLRPGYVRDVASGRWLVALQSRGRVVQKVAVERCSAPGRPCARLADSKCARNLGFRNGARPTTCEQRTSLVPVLTWDPESPSVCPRVKLARFPLACVCRML